MVAGTSTAGAFVLIVLALACAFGLTQAAVQAAGALPEIDLAGSHADKHGGQAIAVRLATNCYDYDYKFVDENTGRTAFCVEFDEDGDMRIGLRIVDFVDGQAQEVTAFIRRSKTTFDQFVRFMARRGYTLK